MRQSLRVIVSGMIAGGKLTMFWAFSGNLYRSTTIEALASYHMEELRRLIAHCVADRTNGYTPSDFPYAELSQGEIDELLGKINPSKKQVHA